MTHGDDDGLVIPPKLAPKQVVILPIYRNDQERSLVMDYCDKLTQELKSQNYGFDRIAVGIDARDGKVATKGWLETSAVLATDLAKQMATQGVAAIIYTDIHRDGTMAGPNLEALRELAATIEIPVIASGGVSSLADLVNLVALEGIGVTGAIVGRAIYTGDINLAEAVKAVGPQRLQDVFPDDGTAIA